MFLLNVVIPVVPKNVNWDAVNAFITQSEKTRHPSELFDPSFEHVDGKDVEARFHYDYENPVSSKGPKYLSVSAGCLPVNQGNNHFTWQTVYTTLVPSAKEVRVRVFERDFNAGTFSNWVAGVRDDGVLGPFEQDVFDYVNYKKEPKRDIAPPLFEVLNARVSSSASLFARMLIEKGILPNT